jgi:hypothetical protein
MIPTAGDPVLDSAGRRYTLAKLVKSGGAGSVYLLREAPQLVAKIYHRDVNHATYARKLEAMLRLSPDLPDIVDGAQRRVQVAWPTASLRDTQGRFVGFLMPAVDVGATSELELILQEKQARAAGLPTALGPKLALAANLAAVVDALHAQRHFIVDLKPVNLRFYRQSLHMALLDCDGFSIQGAGERFPAPQFTPDYLAPEFQRNGVTPEGEQAQDRFALAVVVFQLLNFGIHPFTGRPSSSTVPTDIPGRIAGRWYAYGARGNPGIAPNPGSGHERMAPDLRALFDRAFESSGLARPSPGEWQAVLASYARRSTLRLVACAQDAAHQHYAGMACAQCERAQLLRRTRAAQASNQAQPARTHRPHLPPRRTPGTARPPAMSTLPPVYVPTQPPYRPPTFGTRAWRRFQGRLIAAAMAGCLVGVMTFAEWLSEAFSPSPAAHTVRVVPPAAPPATPSYVSPEASLPTLDAIVGPVRWIGAQAGSAADYDDDLDARVAWLRRRASSASPPSATTLERYREAMTLAERSPRDETGYYAARDKLRDTLGQLLFQDRWAAEVAIELGRIALADGDQKAATRHFTHAVAVAPANAEAWFGYAMTTPRVETQYGALSLAEMLVTDAEQAHALRERYPAPLLLPTGVNLARLDVVSARAQVRAARLRGTQVSRDVQALAARPLP